MGRLWGSQVKYEENILSRSKQTLANYTAFRVALAFASMLAAFTANANPATDHPRLWLNSSDLPRLRSWATSANPMYQDGLLVAANAAKVYADARWNYATQMPASEPMALPGPITALWPAETPGQATLVVRNSKTGNYEASRLGVACAE